MTFASYQSALRRSESDLGRGVLMTIQQDVERSTPQDEARKRIEKRRELASHAVTYVVMNGAFVAIWAVTGGYFWPAWILGCWGAGLLLHAWDALMRRPVTDADVEAELRRRRS